MSKSKRTGKPIPINHENSNKRMKRFSLPHPLWFVLFLSVAVFVIYLPAKNVPPYLDDNSAILENPNVLHSNTAQIYNDFFVNRGLVLASFALEWKLFEEPVKGMHLSNILFHILATISVFFCVRSLWNFLYPHSSDCKIRHYHGLIAACFFALHPINSQPVIYIVQRSVIMTTIFYALGVMLSLEVPKLIPPLKNRSVDRGMRIFSLCLVVGICFALGFSCKATIITMPIMVFITYLYAWRNEKKTTILFRSLLALLPIVLGIGGYLLYRKVTLGSYFYYPDMEARSISTNFFTQCCILVLYYAPRIFIPVNLLFRPTFPPVDHLFDPLFILSFLLLVSLFALALFLFRKSPEISLGIIWIYVSLSPTSSFLPLWDLIAERRLYIPMIGVALIFESLSFRLLLMEQKRIRQWGAGSLLSLLILFPTFTLFRTFEYQNPLRFWYKEYAYDPYNLENLHSYLYRLVETGQTKKAETLLRNLDWNEIKNRNEFIDGASLDTLIRLMLSFDIELDYASLLAKRNAEKFTNQIQFWDTYQIALLKRGQFKDALEIIQQTLKKDSTHVPSYVHLALIYRIFKLYEKAEVTISQALNINANNIEALTELAYIYQDTQRDAAPIWKKIKAIQNETKYSNEINLESAVMK